MLQNILIIGILFIGIYIVLQQHSTENYIDSPDIRKLISDSQVNFSGISALLNPTSGITLPETDMNNALAVVKATANTNGSYSLNRSVTEKFPKGPSAAAITAAACEAAPTTCNAFDDPTFASNCGMSFDVTGTGINGTTHVGGMYVSAPDRQQQLKLFTDAQKSGKDPYKVFKPTIGNVDTGKFSITKDSCRVVKEKVDCAAKQTFDSPNCVQCLTSGEFSRVGPESGRLPIKLYLVGNGVSAVLPANGSLTKEQTLKIMPTFSVDDIMKPLNKDTPIETIFSENIEGTLIKIFCMDAKNPYIAGYIEGQTPSGSFKFDIYNIIYTNERIKKPRISGTSTINGMKCMNIIPDSGEKEIELFCKIPFSFINVTDIDALACSNGPIITTADSATFLESDPCFGKANAPGAYKLECLQSRWIGLGGTPEGTGIPNTQAKADAIQKDANGRSLNINTIVDNLSVKITQALTGKNGNIALSIPEWNAVSLWATGVPITNPCDGPSAGTPACASYLYLNQGVVSNIGPTYTSSTSVATKKEGFNDINAPPDVYNQPGTPLDPTTSTGAAFAAQYGSNINGLQQAYDSISRVANDNTLKNEQRKPQLMQAYGMNIVPMKNTIPENPNINAFVGRYITLQYKRLECLNLAQIAVYSDKGISSNVITPRTAVTKSSGYQGDVYPIQNFVNGLANTFVHTSCYDVPWITVDLGSNTPIYRIVITNRKDCCLERTLGARLYIATDGVGGNTYISDEIQTVNKTYSWFPINPAVYGDLPLDSGPPPRQTIHGNNGTVSCTRYCRGLYGGPWNDELPRSWNGAKCAGYDPRIGGCDVNFPAHSGAGCICERDGRGWLNGPGW